MVHLPEVEKLVRTAVTEIGENRSDLQKCWVIFNVKSLAIQSKVVNHPTDVADTLIKLLSDGDRRVALLSMLVLGEIKDGLQANATRAADQIYKIAWQSKDKLLELAAGLSDALLGSAPAMEWLKNDMMRRNISDINSYKKGVYAMCVKEIAGGWK